MTQSITGVSQSEAEFLSRLAASGRSVFTFGEMRDLWGNQASAARAFHDLESGGWLRRVQRGLYTLIPLSAGPERQWAENPLAVATRLLEPSAIAYWSALRYWNMTEQVPRTVFVQSPNRPFRRDLVVAGTQCRFVFIKPTRFFGLSEQTIEGQPICVTDREKTIMDAADRPDLSGGIRQLAEVLQSSGQNLDWHKLDGYLAKFASGALYKRLGYLVELLSLNIPDRDTMFARWRDGLTEGIATLDPGEPGRAVTQRRWRISDNVFLGSRMESRNDQRG